MTPSGKKQRMVDNFGITHKTNMYSCIRGLLNHLQFELLQIIKLCFKQIAKKRKAYLLDK